MENVCPHCSPKHYFDERAASEKTIYFCECCNSGKIVFPPLTQTSLFLKELFTRTYPMQRQFRQNIGRYSYMIWMTFMKAKWGDKPPELSTLHTTVIVHSKRLHLFFPLQPPPKLPPSFMSVYFHDPYPDYEE